MDWKGSTTASLNIVSKQSVWLIPEQNDFFSGFAPLLF